MIVYLDMDGTIVDLMTPWLSRYNYLYNDDLKPENITQWDITKFVKEGAEEEIIEMLTDDLFRNAEPYDGATEFVEQLMGTHQVRFASRPAGLGVGANAKYEWIDAFFPELGHQQLTLTHYKCSLRGDIIVDDNPEFIKGFEGDKILFSQPWNAGFCQWRHDMARVHGYDELGMLIRELSGAEAARQRFRLRV
jgi:5'(3')-deoxyribonucleotidase